MLLIYLSQATEHRTLWSSYLFRGQKGYGHSSNQPFCGMEEKTSMVTTCLIRPEVYLDQNSTPNISQQWTFRKEGLHLCFVL